MKTHCLPFLLIIQSTSVCNYKVPTHCQDASIARAHHSHTHYRTYSSTQHVHNHPDRITLQMSLARFEGIADNLNESKRATEQKSIVEYPSYHSA